jgi:CubicO group peptidase (beta-lactamase class C family)
MIIFKKTNFKPLIILSLLFALTLTGCGSSPNASDGSLPTAKTTAELITQIDKLIDLNTHTSRGGIVVILKKQGTIVYKRSVGMADVTNNIPMTTNTIFQLASVAKPFTATALMQLVERKLLTLDDSVLKFIPELSPEWHSIKISDLLTHQSGIPDYLDSYVVENNPNWLNGLTNSGIISYYAINSKLDFQPKSQVKYSNTNYVLIAEIISRATSLPFYQYMRDNIFSPAGMSTSFIADDPAHLNDVVALNYGKAPNPYNIKMLTSGPIGQFSSAEDINKFIDALLSYKLITAASLSEMTQAKVTLSGTNKPYAYGWYLGWPDLFTVKNGALDFNHIGFLDGYQSVLDFYNKNESNLIILNNTGQTTLVAVIFQAVMNAK